jgi:hypothetical protein
MMIHTDTSAPIDILGLDGFTTTTCARTHRLSQGPAMECHVARAAKGQSVRHIKPEIREL